MSSAYICRVCLSNSHVKIIANTHLQTVFEKLTSNQLITEDRRPESVCNICYLLLQKCCNFVEVSQKTEEFLTQLFHDGIELTAENLAKTAIHTPNPLSMSNITFVSVPKDNEENLKKVTIKIEPEERKFVENESESQEEIWIHSGLPGLDYPTGSDDDISVTSSVLGMAETKNLNQLEILITGEMSCVSEPDSEASDKDESVVLPSKIHPDNQAFIHKPVEGSNRTMGSIIDDHDLNEGNASYLKRNNLNAKEELRFKLSSDDHEETIQETANTDEPLKSVRQRSWNRRNCCLYCENLVTNYTRHLIRNHPNEIEVLKLMAIRDPNPKEQKKKRQAFTDDLRNRGNYIHNSIVVSRNEGYVIPARRKNAEEMTKSPSNFVVCKQCLGTYRRSTFYRHSKRCYPDNENDLTLKHTLARHAISIIPFYTHALKGFQENILPRLRNDEISLLVKQDPLIIAYGCRLLEKKKERRSRKSICSNMRDLAHLLKIVRAKNPDIAQLQDLINPKYYENFIEAVKVMSGFNEETGCVKIISIPARIRPEILGCIEILFTDTIMDGYKSTAEKDHIKRKLSEFKLLLEANWQWEISPNAAKTLKRNLITKIQIMPLEQDIEKEMIQIHNLEEKYYNNLINNITNVNYENLCEVTIAHIILLDRKQSGDIAEAELQFYLNRRTYEIPPQVLETLDKNKKQAISDLDIFQIPGKQGRSVPILLTKIMRRNIDVIISCRSNLKISSKNKYLFARPLTEGPFDGGRCLNRIKNEMSDSCEKENAIDKNGNCKVTENVKFCDESEVDNCEYENKCNIEDNIAKENETDKTDYNKDESKPNKVTETDDYDEQSDNCNKKSEKNGKITEKKNNNASSDYLQREKDEKQTNNEIKPIMDGKQKTMQRLQSSDTESSIDMPLKRKNDESDEEVGEQKQKRLKKTHNKWSSAEVEAVMRHLKKFILLKKNPGKALCEEVLRKETVLHKRTWMQINAFINNIYKKNL